LSGLFEGRRNGEVRETMESREREGKRGDLYKREEEKGCLLKPPIEE
jgi:hypothetical protein